MLLPPMASGRRGRGLRGAGNYAARRSALLLRILENPAPATNLRRYAHPRRSRPVPPGRLSGDILPDLVDKANHCLDAIRYALLLFYCRITTGLLDYYREQVDANDGPEGRQWLTYCRRRGMRFCGASGSSRPSNSSTIAKQARRRIHIPTARLPKHLLDASDGAQNHFSHLTRVRDHCHVT
jgi:hypothetical protein